MDTLEYKARAMVHALNQRNHFSRDLIALYSSRTLMRISLGVLGVFLPIFFYKEFNYDLQIVIVIYISIFGISLLITPISARLLSILGTRPMIFLGLLFCTLSLFSLYFFSVNPGVATLTYIVFVALYRALYWIPYHVDFSHALNKNMRGRQLATLGNIASVVLIAVPMIGGLLITSAGFSAVFIIAIALMIASLFPLWFMNNGYEQFSWDYLGSFQHLFARGNRSLFLAHAANGAQGMAITVFWPIYVFVLLDERYTALGVITSLTIVVVIGLRWVVGTLFDTWSQRRMLVVGVLLATTGWVTKIFVQTPFGIFVADSYHNFGQTVNTLSFDATTYEQSADNGRYVDEYTALKEMALSVGRILMLLVMAVSVATFGMRFAFILAASVALLMIVLNKKSKLQ